MAKTMPGRSNSSKFYDLQELTQKTCLHKPVKVLLFGNSIFWAMQKN
jgi:hypothetical protein